MLSLQAYINRTNAFRSAANKHVFLSLHKPHQGLTVQSISRILNESIKSVGLSGSAKDFRPTGATSALQAGMSEVAVMKVGRWRSADVFREHYVHYKSSPDYTDKVLGTT